MDFICIDLKHQYRNRTIVSLFRLSVITILSIILLDTIFAGCRVDKKELSPPPIFTPTSSNSSIALVNLEGPLELSVNNVSLTNRGNGKTTPFFPTSGQFTASNSPASLFYIPTYLLDASGNAHIQIGSLSETFNGSFLSGTTNINSYQPYFDTLIQNNPTNPLDYFIVNYPHTYGAYALSYSPLIPYSFHIIPVPRAKTPSSDAQKFKIRLINFSSSHGNLEINNPLTLTYSDSTTVNPVTSNILPGQVSDYAEVPYGAYQFKVFDSRGTQLTELKVGLLAYDMKDTTTNITSSGVYSVIRSYKPGGIYSVVVNGNPGAMKAAGFFQDPVSYFLNAYSILSENSPPLNNSFCHIQFANALPGGKLSLIVDGNALGVPQNFGSYTPTQTYSVASHLLSLIDSTGNVLYSLPLNTQPYDEWTVFSYPDSSSKTGVSLTLSANNLTYSHLNDNVGAPYNGNALLFKNSPFTVAMKFLNLSVDIPYASFYQGFIPINFPYTSKVSPALNLFRGQIVTDEPYVEVPSYYSSRVYPASTLGGFPIDLTLSVYSSNPGPPAILPGFLLSNLAPDNVPSESGIYTIALIGQTNSISPEFKARVMIIKNNN